MPQTILRALLDTVEKGVVVTDREGRLLMVNAVAGNTWPATPRTRFYRLTFFRNCCLLIRAKSLVASIVAKTNRTGR